MIYYTACTIYIALYTPHTLHSAQCTLHTVYLQPYNPADSPSVKLADGRSHKLKVAGQLAAAVC